MELYNRYIELNNTHKVVFASFVPIQVSATFSASPYSKSKVKFVEYYIYFPPKILSTEIS